MKVYGPYTRDDGRKHVILYDHSIDLRRTVSYPKYIMEQHLNRSLEDHEEIHHIDEDFTNNAIDNLEIITRSDHAKYRGQQNKIYTENKVAQCVWCLKEFTMTLQHQRSRNDVRSKDKTGPFCSRSCIGKYSTSPID